MFFRKFPLYRQLDVMDCGPTSLKMIAKYYGKEYSLAFLREKCYIGREGVSMLGISDCAESMGFNTLAARLDPAELNESTPVPFIAHWIGQHFLVVYKVKGDKVYVADPGKGRAVFTRTEFMAGWIPASPAPQQGVALFLEPREEFYKTEGVVYKSSFRFLLSYFYAYKRLILQIFMAILAGSALQVAFPFLTQAIVDHGIKLKDLSFITYVLIGQLMLFLSRTFIEVIKGWILLYIGNRVNISIISDFLRKLMKLPLRFFNSKMTGDILQRVNDHHRVTAFLTGSSLSILLSSFNFLVFSVILFIYTPLIFGIFALGCTLYVGWILFFLKARRDIDNRMFMELSDNQNNLIQLLEGMSEIKLNNCEEQKRSKWEKIQAALLRLNMRSLMLSQYQYSGGMFISELRNIIVSFVAARGVIYGDLTLGMMLAIMYIIAQLDAPVMQFVSFIQSGQDAKISLERMAEIHNQPDENASDAVFTDIPPQASLSLCNLKFRYDGPRSPAVVDDLSFDIPYGKVTAIVGLSGSGKTTLLRLLLRFYDPETGVIRAGNVPLTEIDSRLWRQRCGVVMQEGYIFSDTIEANIALSDETPDPEKIRKAVEIAHIGEFIESLPLGYHTRVGQNGVGLSQGQKQRLLIARAAYKNPEYIFFDEATNALDAHNERVIMDNFSAFFENKTVVIVAHRLSTVKNADQIVVLHQGKVAEKGTHESLIAQKGPYYRLVKDQLEIQLA